MHISSQPSSLGSMLLFAYVRLSSTICSRIDGSESSERTGITTGRLTDAPLPLRHPSVDTGPSSARLVGRQSYVRSSGHYWCGTAAAHLAPPPPRLGMVASSAATSRPCQPTRDKGFRGWSMANINFNGRAQLSIGSTSGLFSIISSRRRSRSSSASRRC